MDVVISAGPTPGKIDPLLAYAQADRKALIPIAGRPMIKWVTDALIGSRYIDRVIVIGLDESCGIDFGSKPVIFLPAQGRLVANYVAGVERALRDTTDRQHILIAACDIPLITTSIVNDHIAAMLQTKHDVYYTIIRKETMLAKFPTSRRSYARIREGIFCGGSLHMISAKVMASDSRTMWNELLERRKNVFRQASLIGLDVLLRLLTGTLTLAAAEKRADKILGVRCKAFVTPHAEIGMDVDKPFQLDIARAMLNEQ
jgi:molybdopterin-guanine dinucleotide biosynthesis protein A